MTFALGYIAGALTMGFLAVIVFRKKEEIIREVMRPVSGKVAQILGESVEILELEPSDIRAMENVIKENEEKGRDTPIKDLQ